MENKEKTNLLECCKPKNNNNNNNNKGSKSLIQGIIFGTIPHLGCIAFIVFSILGVTFAASLFKPLLAKAYFFYFMILLSFVFATISALFYLRKQGGIKKAGEHKRYLSILYGTTIGIGLIMYFLIFPMISNVTASSVSEQTNQNSEILIKVSIPCEGHASLITNELKKLNGIGNIEFTSPNNFKIFYDNSKTNKQEILSLNIFKEYPAQIINS